jgi:hypothetical protein
MAPNFKDTQRGKECSIGVTPVRREGPHVQCLVIRISLVTIYFFLATILRPDHVCGIHWSRIRPAKEDLTSLCANPCSPPCGAKPGEKPALHRSLLLQPPALSHHHVRLAYNPHTAYIHLTPADRGPLALFDPIP